MAVLRCLGHLLRAEEPLELDDLQRRRAQLPLARGRMGLRSAERGRSAAQSGPSVRTAAEAAEALRDGGFQPPAWDELLRLDPRSQGRDFGDYTRGWQRAAGMVLDEAGLLADLDLASRVLFFPKQATMPGASSLSSPPPPSSASLTLTFGLRPCTACACRSPSVSGCARVGAPWMPWGTIVRRARAPAC